MGPAVLDPREASRLGPRGCPAGENVWVEFLDSVHQNKALCSPNENLELGLMNTRRAPMGPGGNRFASATTSTRNVEPEIEEA